MVVGQARRSNASDRLRSRDRTHFSPVQGLPAVSGSTNRARSVRIVVSFFPRADARHLEVARDGLADRGAPGRVHRGRCEYRHPCGGSRARAYAVTGDPLESDPDCNYVPIAMRTPEAGAAGPTIM